ncbi:hypothetical protein HK105_202840 [Polyrhizophydium stewartii]|uniref:MHYT domain-containing protein n=1 Tax=Polyrhizophydium stewartii TaxID=2732419 RepID=A0ABR4NDF3_9FUNG|nr:hypothetical protein HK105_003580 [Polyrhizophydium stewartii]
MSAIKFQTSVTDDYVFTVEYDIFLVAVSYWTAVTGAYTGIQVVDQLLRMYRKYIAINVTQLLNKMPKIKNPVLKRLYTVFHINPKIILSIFLVATALGGCGIWGMHFLGMYALQIYALPKETNSTLPYFNPYTERVHRSYFVVIPIYYEATLTAMSLVIAVGVVFVGMLIAAFGVGMIYTRIEPRDLYAIMQKHQDKDEKQMMMRSSFFQNMAHQSRLSQVASASPADPSRYMPPTKSMHRPSEVGQLISAHRSSDAGQVMSIPRAGDPAQVMSVTSGISSDHGLGTTIRIDKMGFLELSMERKLIFLLGSTITGLGAAAMHYMGVASMRIPDVHMRHNPLFVGLAILIGVVVATAGLWIIFFLKGRVQRLMAPLVIGIAVFSLHYTAMAGVTFELTGDPLKTSYNKFFAENPTAIGGMTIETLRGQIDFSLELVILAVGFHMLKVE